MSSFKQSVMAEHTLQELFNRNSSGKSQQKRPYVLALITSHLIGMEPGLLYVKTITKKPILTTISAEDSIFYHYKKEELVRITGNDHWIPQHRLSKSHPADIIFIPILSFSLVSDILSFNERRPFVRTILHSLLTGKKVIGLRIGIDPYHQFWRLNGMDKGSQFLKRKLRDQMIELKAMGIKLINDDEDLAEHFETSNRKTVVTAETIRYLHQHKQNRLTLTKETIITPLAKDIASEFNIALIKNKGTIFHANGNSSWPDYGNEKG